MKIKKAAAVILACSIVIGHTVWAAEPQEIVQENVETKGNESSNVEIKDEAEEQNQSEPDEVITAEQDSALHMPEENADIPQTQNGEIEEQADVQELALYTGYDRFINIACGDWDASYTEYEVQVENESICKAEISGKNNADLIVKFQPLKQGNTQVKIFKTGREGDSLSYSVNIRELPEDAVPFEDAGLRSTLLQGFPMVDRNGDGYISIGEFESVTNLTLNNKGITSIKGLEYAPHLRELNLNDNPELTDVSVLFRLEELETLWITGTNVSDEDRWQLADFKDFDMDKGNIAYLPSGYHVFEGDSDFLVEVVENGESVKLSASSYVTVEKSFILTALQQGKAKLKITCGETFSTEITVTINGIDSDQEVGEIYTEPVEIKSWGYDDYNYMADMVVLNGNGELWETCPEVQLIKDNVKDCSTGHIDVPNGKSFWVKYLLDQNNDLWNGDEKIASDVQKYDGHYALNSEGTLNDLYNMDTIPPENVKDWVVNPYGFTVYVLKNDGTLWSRDEVSADEKSNSFVKIADGIAELYEFDLGYLSVNGDCYYYGQGNSEPYLKGVKKVLRRIDRSRAYCGTDGCFYLMDNITGQWNNVGKIDINVQDFIKTDFGCIVLSEEGELFECAYGGKAVKLDSGIKEISSLYDTEKCVCKKTDGTYFYYEIGKEGMGDKKEFSKENPCIIADWGISRLYYTNSENDCIVVRHGVEILDHVTYIWAEDFDREFALRTDGTIWDITSVPEMILDLATSTYVPGDVNEDGVVNIEDLRLILRGVCGKIDLTERQTQIADVAADGKVDIQDLRKVLRYVCGKITEL